LINDFTNYITIKQLSNDLTSMSDLMKSLKGLGSIGSWQQTIINIPIDYNLYFNNESDSLEITGAEELIIPFNSDIIYALNLTSGNHLIQLYYGLLNYDDVKNETVVFQ
jgi:hypothetical protein